MNNILGTRIEGQRITSIDMTTDPHTVIFEDIPKTENQELAERVNLLENALNEILLS